MLTKAEERVRNGTLQMIDRYIDMIHSVGFGLGPVRSPDGLGLCHALWMLDEMKKELLDENPFFDLWKASRWLGFVQHEVIYAGFTTVEAERDFSRPLFKG